MSQPVIQTYVWNGGKCFMVSTIERDSSAAYGGPMRYNETIVWNYDWQARERGAMRHQDSDSKGSIAAHQRTVEAIHEVGEKAFTT